MTLQSALIQRLSDKTALIGVVGLGYVGLPLVLRYSEVGYSVIGFDIDLQKIDKLCNGSSYIENIADSAIQQWLHRGGSASSDFSQTAHLDALILCVPTPLNQYREPDLSHVLNTIETLLPYLHPGQIVSLESTTYPGTTEEELRPRIESCGFKIGEDLFLIFSPEREDPGNKHFNTRTIPKVCGGSTPNCLAVGQALYGSVIDQVIPVSNTKTAEMTKLLENIQRAVNIGLINEMKMVADKMGIDIHEVVRAAATKPFGFMPYYPGPGLGGHCIPIDPFYLTWKARAYNLHPRFIELAGEINATMPEWVIAKVTAALNQNYKAVRGSRILLLGIAYKKNVDDLRESPAIQLMQQLHTKGAEVSYSDPHIAVFPKTRQYHCNLTSISLSAATLAAFDLVLLVTDHDQFDYAMIQQHAQLIVDTRGVYPKATHNVIMA